MQTISIDINEIQEVRKKKEYAKLKLIERCGEPNWKNSRYVLAISSMVAYIYDIDEYLKLSNSVLEEIIICIACLNKSASQLLKGKSGNLNQLKNYCQLTDSDNTSTTREIRQRTSTWFERRNVAKVTGSTIYSAVGLDGLKRQQEHFEKVICGIQAAPPSEKVAGYMKYGQDKEPSAMLTLVGKVLPVILPEKKVYEEGFVEMDLNGKSEPFIVVSPDGSIRGDQSMESTQMAVELKCPVMELQKTIPPRYMLQCQSEMDALGVTSLVYLCWRPDFSSVFIIRKTDQLYSTAYKLAEEVYKSEFPRRVKALTPGVKQLKVDVSEACRDENTVKFVGIFPSVNHVGTDSNAYEDTRFNICRVEHLILQIIKAFDNKYELLRQRATEAVVFLCGVLDRMNTRCTAAPVCWFTKGYSLDSSTMRNVAEHVLNECAKQGIHIPAISFDGQWHTLAVRDETNQPLTKLQLQKDVWRETEVMKKQEILCEIRKCNKRPAWLSAKNNRDGIISYTMYNETGKHVPIISESVRKQRQHDIETLRKRNIADIQLNQNKTCDDEEPNDFRDTAINVDIQDTVDIDINIPVAETTEQINVNERITTSKHGGGLTEEIEENTAVQNNIQNKHDTACDDHITKRLHIDMDRATVILNMLKTDQHTNKRGIWNDKTPIDIVKTMQSAENLKTLRDTELKVVVRYLKRIGHPHLKESVNKACKLINICKVLGLPDVDVISENSQPRYRKRSRPNVVKSLQDIAFIELSKLRKADLNIIYAEYVWPDKLSKWQQKALVYKTELYHTVSAKSDSDDDACSTSTKSSGCDFFYIPSYSASRDQFEVSCVDSSHLLTRTRRKCCKGGLDGYSNAAWRTVAKSGNTSLSLPMIDCVVDQMSVPTAVTHFSEAVENEMIQNGYIEEALLCKDIRGWWRADDEPGIPASDRVELRMPIRQRLLSRKDIGTFPPPGMYVNGWPTVLWEAMLANIDAKTHLYSLTKQKTYNTRAFSSLVGETFFSEVTLFDRRGQGTVTASEFQSFIGTAIENLHVRLDNEKHFAYHTSKKHVYPLLDADDYRTDEADTASNTNGNRLPNHFFDTKERARVKGRNKEEHISTTRNAVQRGSLGVRWEKARRNDSKLLPTMKMGIDC